MPYRGRHHHLHHRLSTTEEAGTRFSLTQQHGVRQEAETRGGVSTRLSQLKYVGVCELGQQSTKTGQQE